MNALANMGANMSAMLSGASPLTKTQSDHAEDTEIGAVEKPPVLDSCQSVRYRFHSGCSSAKC